MTDVTLSILLMGISPLVVMAIQCVLFRLPARSGKSPQSTTILAMVIGYVPFFAIAESLPFEVTRDFIFRTYLFGLYSFCAYTYFHIFNMSETSRRIRMLAQIASSEATGGFKDAKNLEDIYDAKQMLATRLDRLVALGQIEKGSAGYLPKRPMITYTAVLLFGLSRLLGMPWDSILRYQNRKR